VSDGSYSGRCKSGITTIEEILNARHHIFSNNANTMELQTGDHPG